MHGCDAGRARDARLMNGVALVGGRGVSSLEVDIALGVDPGIASGLDPRPAQTSNLLKLLRALVARCAVVRETQTMSAERGGMSD